MRSMQRERRKLWLLIMRILPEHTKTTRATAKTPRFQKNLTPKLSLQSCPTFPA